MAIKNIQTAHLVHDLKNPVNIIETGVRSLLESQDRYGQLNPKQEKVLQRLLRNTLKIRQLANSMLEVDMASLGIVRTRDCTMSSVLKAALVEVFDLVDPDVADALEHSDDLATFQQLLRTNEIFLEAEESQLNRTIQVDETKLCLVITNLLSNAFKYRQKRVFLKCVADGDSLSIAVRDDGPGIPECYHQQIFDQYFQCMKVEGFPVRGHGLGLAGAQALTEALGGSLSLCKSPHGAEFVVSLRFSQER